MSQFNCSLALEEVVEAQFDIPELSLLQSRNINSAEPSNLIIEVSGNVTVSF